VILEAMAHGKPVVATAVDGVPEVIEDGVTGLLFPHEDHSLLAEHLLGLIGDPKRARSLASAAQEELATRFSPRRFAADLAGLYREALRCEHPSRQAAAW
jgi:glycosyltransferase involved in cell wall biosynthesis